MLLVLELLCMEMVGSGCTAIWIIYYRSSQMHLHIMLPFFSRKLEVHPIISQWKKKTFKRFCNLQDFKFYLDKLNAISFPLWCNVDYTPGIYAEGYIVFIFPFVCSFVCSSVRDSVPFVELWSENQHDQYFTVQWFCLEDYLIYVHHTFGVWISTTGHLTSK